MQVSRGEIWLVNLDPTIGAEIRKTRPVVVVSSDAIGALPIKLVAPITEWKDYLAQNIWHVFEEIIQDYYPDLQVEDIRACIRYVIDVMAAEDIHISVAVPA